MGGIGGGDLKMLAAVGAMEGAAFVFVSFLAAAVAGGIIGMVVAIVRGSEIETFKRIKTILSLLLHRINPSDLYPESKDDKRVFPYAGAVAIGAVTAFFCTRFITG